MPNSFSKQTHLQELYYQIPYKKSIKCLNAWILHSKSMKGYYKNLLKNELNGQISTVMVASVNIDKRPTSLMTTSRR